VTDTVSPASLRVVEPTWDEDRLLLVAWTVVMAVAWWRFASISSDRTFMYDEWNFVLNRWQFELDSFMRPHNSHASMIPAAVFFLLFRAIGLANYGVYQAVGYLTHFLVATLLLIAVSRRLGLRIALPVATAFLFLGTAAENTLWPFQIGSMGSIAGCLFAMLALDSTKRRAPWLVAAGLLISLGSAGFGVVAVAGVGVEVLLRRLDRRYWLAVVAPAALWFGWYLAYGTSEAQGENLSKVAPYVHESFAGTVAALVRAPLAWGFVACWILGALVATTIVRKPLHEARLVGLVVIVAAYWSLTALSRAQYWSPLGSRYVYVAAPFVLLAIVELLRNLDRRVLAPAVLVFCVWSMTATWDAMTAHGRWLREWGEAVGVELRVLESRLDTVPRDYRPDPTRAPDVAAGPYRRAITALSTSPAFDAEAAAAASPASRAEADRVLSELGAFSVETTESPVGCRPGTESTGEILLGNGSQLVMLTNGPSEIGLRAYADEPLAATRVQAPSDRALRVTIDARLPDEQWRLVLFAADARACLGQ